MTLYQRRSVTVEAVLLTAVAVVFGACAPDTGAAFEEFCIRGEFDLGARLQGRQPAPGESYPAQWCVVTSEADDRVRFSAAGRSNPDAEGTFTISYPSPNRVRLVNDEAPPDVEFRGALAEDEARSIHRIDPRRLVAELAQHPEWVVAEHEGGRREVRWPGAQGPSEVLIQDDRVHTVRTMADLPLRGRVPVVWTWRWESEASDGDLELSVDGETLFRGVGERRSLTREEVDALWHPSGGLPPREVPGGAWPSVVRMSVETLQPGVHVVRGVRTGFHHLVVETGEGLVVADAPAGWVELHQLPPADLVPGLGVSGLSERLIDFLRSQWPDAPIRAVVLTHGHDDHAGGARAFAAAGAEVYAPAADASFFEEALNRETMPEDRLSMAGGSVRVIPVDTRLEIADAERPIELIAIGRNPHVDAALGVYVPAAGVFFQSDLHVPRSDVSEPRSDRLEMECWFARWAAQTLPLEAVVYNSHGPIGTPVSRLAAYLAHEGCAGSGE